MRIGISPSFISPLLILWDHTLMKRRFPPSGRFHLFPLNQKTYLYLVLPLPSHSRLVSLLGTRLSERGSWCDVTSSLSPGVACLFVKFYAWATNSAKSTRRLDFACEIAYKLHEQSFLWYFIRREGSIWGRI